MRSTTLSVAAAPPRRLHIANIACTFVVIAALAAFSVIPKNVAKFTTSYIDRNSIARSAPLDKMNSSRPPRVARASALAFAKNHILEFESLSASP